MLELGLQFHKVGFVLVYWFVGEALIDQTRQQSHYCLSLSLEGSRKGSDEHEPMVDRMQKEIESNQDSALSLCTEKVLLARQAYELVVFLSLFLLRKLSKG